MMLCRNFFLKFEYKTLKHATMGRKIPSQSATGPIEKKGHVIMSQITLYFIIFTVMSMPFALF